MIGLHSPTPQHVRAKPRMVHLKQLPPVSLLPMCLQMQFKDVGFQKFCVIGPMFMNAQSARSCRALGVEKNAKKSTRLHMLFTPLKQPCGALLEPVTFDQPFYSPQISLMTLTRLRRSCGSLPEPFTEKLGSRKIGLSVSRGAIKSSKKHRLADCFWRDGLSLEEL